jgi:hypothetical protein
MSDYPNSQQALCSDFPEMIRHELGSAREKHSKQNNLNEFSAVLQHQIIHFFNLLRQPNYAEHPDKILARLVKIAAAAQRAAEDFLL